MVGLLYRFPIYMAPFFMAGMEVQLNEVAKRTDASSLLGPSVAAAAIGVILPVLKPSTASTPTWKTAFDRGASALGMSGLLVGFYLWHMLVAANLGVLIPAWVPALDIFSLGRGASMAILLYVFAVFLSEVKTLVEK